MKIQNIRAVIASIINFKGGVAKTTTTQNLGAALAVKGKKVLLVDADPQCNLTQGFGIHEPQYDLLNLMVEDGEFAPVHINENLHLVPGSIQLINAERIFADFLNEKAILQECLEPLRDQYDYILIDCPPAFNLLTSNAIVARDFIIVPVQCETFPYNGLATIFKRLAMNKIRVDKVLATHYDSVLSIQKRIKNELYEKLPQQMFKTVIRKNTELSKAQDNGKSVFDFNTKCNGAKDYLALAEEIINEYSA